MPIRLTLLERLLLRLNLFPGPLLDMPLSVGIAKSLVVASDIGLFDALRSRPLSVEELAQQLQCNPQGLHILLQILAFSGYLSEYAGRYRNSRMAKRWLTQNSSFNIAPYILHSPDIIAIWDHLPEVVREGKQVLSMPYEEDKANPQVEAFLSRHYAGLASLGLALGREVINRVQLPPNATQLLDVCGSHAAYSVLFCRKYAHLNATILDIQSGIEAGKRTAIQTNMEHRLRFVCGDIVRDDLAELLAGDGDQLYDAALYFHIAHLLPAEENAMILARIAKLLKPGGALAFLDQVTDQTHGSRLAGLMTRFMALTMTSVGGTSYPFPIVKSWLEQAGLSQVRTHRLLNPGATLITAKKL
jgi:hypothetical protein